MDAVGGIFNGSFIACSFSLVVDVEITVFLFYQNIIYHHESKYNQIV